MEVEEKEYDKQHAGDGNEEGEEEDDEDEEEGEEEMDEEEALHELREGVRKANERRRNEGRPKKKARGAAPAAGADTQAGGPSQPYYRPEKLVRTDHKTQTLDAFLSNPLKRAAVGGEEGEGGRGK